MSKPRQSGVRVLVLSNGVTSAERQCLGLLRALWPGLTRASADVELLLVVDWSSPASCLLRRLPAAVHVLAGSRFAGVDVATLAAQADAALLEGLLTLLVACGRDTVAAAVALRAASRAFIAVQLLHPRVPLSAFDLCVVPAHDSVACDARVVHRTLGVLHDFDEANLAAARMRWAAALSSRPRPLVACLVGAPTANCPYDCTALSHDIAALAADVERCGGCLSICPSRRTPPGLVSALRWAVMGHRSASFVPLDGEGNAFAGLLAWCDELVITADSISMVSEAASTVCVIFSAHRMRWLTSSSAHRARA